MAVPGDVPDLYCNDYNMRDDDSDDDDSDGWNEIDMGDEPCVDCLFCQKTYQKMDDVLNHCKEQHNFDIVYLKGCFKMDCYGFIKMVNFIRANKVDSSLVMEAKEPLWEKEEYMKPVQIDDPWLMYDFEDLEVPSSVRSGEDESVFHITKTENGCVTLSEQHFADLQRTIEGLSIQIHEKDSMIQNMLEDMKCMRQVTQQLVNSGGESGLEVPVEKCVKAINLQDDEGYFSTYAHFSIHHEMLSDSVRTLSYKKALTKNADILKGKTVLDLGCGTGILSMFAASAGAQQVIAVDQSDIIYHAMEIIRENNMSEKVTLVKGRLEDTELPQNEVDVILSEWMGYFLLFEGMLDSVIYARDKHLAKGGLLLPNRCSISLVGLADLARHNELIGFWTDVYGYQMNCMQREVVREPTVEVVPLHKVVTTASTVLQLDLNVCTVNSMDFSAEFSLHVIREEILTALIGYFDVFFDLPQPVSFSTGPHAAPTHWKQTVFFLEEPIPVNQGDTLTGKLICQRHRKDVRSLTVTLLLSNKKYKYILS